MVRTSSDPTTGRGELMRWLAALGLALGLLAIPVGLTATAAKTGSGIPADRPGVTYVERAPAVPAAAQPGDHAPYLPLSRSSEEPTSRPAEAPASSTTPRPKSGVPVRLLIPELGVGAPVVPITAPGGVLLPPGDPQVLGWWRHGARPGARQGGALITGHTVHTGGGAFDNLETLAPGDTVRVATRRGTIEYAVTHVRIYRKASLARHAGEVFSQQVPGRLVLITCEGWNGAGYDSNAVVLARPI